MDGFNNNYRRVHRITIVNKTLILSDKDKQELAKYAESEKPYESCAILIGNEDEKILFEVRPPIRVGIRA